MRPIRYSLTGVANGVPIPLDLYLTPFNASLTVEVTGTITYSVQWTQDNIWDPTATPVWFAAADNVTAASNNQAASLTSPVTAVRLITTAGTGTAKLTVT